MTERVNNKNKERLAQEINEIIIKAKEHAKEDTLIANNEFKQALLEAYWFPLFTIVAFFILVTTLLLLFF